MTVHSEKTLTLSNASGSLATDGNATETIQNRDPPMKRLLAGLGRTAEAAHPPKKGPTHCHPIRHSIDAAREFLYAAEHAVRIL